MAVESAKVEEPGKALLEKFEFPEDPHSNPPEPVAEEPKAEVKAEPVAPAAPKHPSWLTRAAKLAGVSDDDMAEMSSGELEKAIPLFAASKKQDQNEREFISQTRQRDESGRFTKQEDQPQAVQPTKEEAFNLKELGIDASKWSADATTEQILTDVLKPLVAKIRELETGVKQVAERDQIRERNAHFDRLDQKFAANEALFGKGQRSELGRDSDELARRVAVINEITRINQSNPNMPFNEAFDRATKRLNYVSQPKAEVKPEPIDDDPHGFRNGATIQPTNRATKPPPKGDQSAKAKVAEILKQRASSEPTTELDDLPD